MNASYNHQGESDRAAHVDNVHHHQPSRRLALCLRIFSEFLAIDERPLLLTPVKDSLRFERNGSFFFCLVFLMNLLAGLF